MTKILVSDGLYVPIRFVDKDKIQEVQEKFTKDFFKKETVCERCEYWEERVCDVCETCPNFVGRLVLAKEVVKNDKAYLRMPFGARKTARQLFEKPKFVFRTVETPMVRPIKFMGTLRDHQLLPVKAIIKAKTGVLKSPPRSGKTVIAAAAICKLGQKTLILAAQHEWLDNFKETFLGSDTQKAMTNATERRVGMAKTLEQFKRLDVAFATYHTFLSPKGKKLLKKIKKMFNVVFVDEIQTGNATEFASIINTLVAEYKIGLSGTPERKDNKHWVIEQLMGPVFFNNEVARLAPEVRITHTQLGGRMPTSWTYMVGKIEKDPKRLMLIAKMALKDIAAGHLVFIPLARVEVINALAATINKLNGRTIAVPFHGKVSKLDRKTIIDKARNYKIKVLIGTLQLLSTGINIPRASCLYEVSMSANQPKAEQRFSRILTPYDGKPQPIIRYFLDDVDVRKSCIRSEFFGTLLPKFKPKMKPEVREVFYNYMNKKKPKGGYYPESAIGTL